jgi:hypothetical protein
VLTYVGALPPARPEVLVARAGEAFDAQGNLADEAARGFLQEMLAALADWTERVSPAIRMYV